MRRTVAAVAHWSVVLLAAGSALSAVRIAGWLPNGERRTIWIPPFAFPVMVSITRLTGYRHASVIGYLGSRGRERHVAWLRAR